jgi:aspartate 1-decarboxylase
MKRQMLRAKLHRVAVTERDVEYEGSLSLDPALMDACGMVPYERVEVYNLTLGSRFATYLIEAERGSGACCVNGAAAHLVEVGDRLILAAYCEVEDSEVPWHRPRIVLVGTDNRIREVKTAERAGSRVGR